VLIALEKLLTMDSPIGAEPRAPHHGHVRQLERLWVLSGRPRQWSISRGTWAGRSGG